MAQILSRATASRRLHLAIVQPEIGKPSETFLDSHVRKLPADTTVIHGLPPMVDGRYVLGDGVLERARRALQRLRPGPSSDWSTRAYLEVLRRRHIDVVLAQYGVTGVDVMEACRLTDVPLVVHFHGYDAWDGSTVSRYRDAYARLFDGAAAIISGCQSMTRHLVELGAERSRVVTNYVSTVIPEEFPDVADTPRPPLFVAVGRFVEKKAPHLTILAFSKAAALVPDIRLRFVGDGPLLSSCRQLARALGVDDKITFLGAQPAEVVRAEMQRARGFVQHSVEAPGGDREGTGISTLEAAMTGLAICATRHEGIAETMIDGVTSLLVEEFDVDGMAHHLASVGTDLALAQELGRSASVHARSNFTLAHSVGRLTRILEAVAARQPVDPIRSQIEQEWQTGTTHHPLLDDRAVPTPCP